MVISNGIDILSLDPQPGHEGHFPGVS